MIHWIRKNIAFIVLPVIAFSVSALFTYQTLATQALKEQLVRYIASRSEQRTAVALDGLRQHGWQHDPALHNLDLSFANYSGLDLNGIDLRGGNFYNAYLPATTMHQTVLRNTNLQQAALHNADLHNADLRGADLRGAYLTGANLAGADLEGAQFGPSTLLPSYVYWTPDTDMATFTDASHPAFWRSTEENSPAYDSQAQPAISAPAAPAQPTPTLDLGQS